VVELIDLQLFDGPATWHLNPWRHMLDNEVELWLHDGGVATA
jgi:hypothetical protein